MMAYPVPRLGGPCPPGRTPTQLLMAVPRSQEGGSSPNCCTPVSAGSSSVPQRPGGCLVGPPGSGGLCSCCPPGSNLLAAGYPGGLLPGLAEGMAAHPFLAAHGLSTFPPETAGIYPPVLGGAFDPKDNHEFWAALRQAPYFPYEQGLMAHPYANAFALDPNARRKNATREGTNTLKAWLNEHKKNPYPTKGEKIMLAIITKMTLTQVSTWFANARRRLKKDNKVTWTTRGTDDDDDDALGSSDEEGPSNRKSGGSQNGVEDDLDPDEDICVTDDDNEAIDSRLFSAESSPAVQGSPRSTEPGSRVTPTPDSSEDHQRIPHPRTPRADSNHGQTTSPPYWLETQPRTANIDSERQRKETPKPTNTKPKIWSLADVASKDSPDKLRQDRISGSEANVTSSSGLTTSPMRASGPYPGAWGSAMMYPYPRHVIPQHTPTPMTSPSSAMTLATSSSPTAGSPTH